MKQVADLIAGAMLVGLILFLALTVGLAIDPPAVETPLGQALYQEPARDIAAGADQAPGYLRSVAPPVSPSPVLDP